MQMDAEKRYKAAMRSVGSEASGAPLRAVLIAVVLAGEHASDWARRAAKPPQIGIEMLRLALADLCHHYGIAKNDKKTSATKLLDAK